jgi:hypothetical protein
MVGGWQAVGVSCYSLVVTAEAATARAATARRTRRGTWQQKCAMSPFPWQEKCVMSPLPERRESGSGGIGREGDFSGIPDWIADLHVVIWLYSMFQDGVMSSGS